MDLKFMQKILVLSPTNDKKLEAVQISNEKTQYIVFNDLEYAVGYLYASKKKYRPDIILIDHDLELIQKFIDLCHEIHVDINKYQLITTNGDSYNKIDIKKQKFIYINPLGNDDIGAQFFVN
jgi:glutamine cyclotransferase